MLGVTRSLTCDAALEAVFELCLVDEADSQKTAFSRGSSWVSGDSSAAPSVTLFPQAGPTGRMSTVDCAQSLRKPLHAQRRFFRSHTGKKDRPRLFAHPSNAGLARLAVATRRVTWRAGGVRDLRCVPPCCHERAGRRRCRRGGSCPGPAEADAVSPEPPEAADNGVFPDLAHPRALETLPRRFPTRLNGQQFDIHSNYLRKCGTSAFSGFPLEMM